MKETLKYGDRIADPGEFTKRAFLNGKINLQQSESVIDLIHSKSEQELTAALKCYTGQASVGFDRISKKLFDLRSEIEALIDFSEEEINISISNLFESLKTILDELEPLLKPPKGISLRLPTIVLRGRPNVGKSQHLINLPRKMLNSYRYTWHNTRYYKRRLCVTGNNFIFDTAGMRNLQTQLKK